MSQFDRFHLELIKGCLNRYKTNQIRSSFFPNNQEEQFHQLSKSQTNLLTQPIVY